MRHAPFASTRWVFCGWLLVVLGLLGIGPVDAGLTVGGESGSGSYSYSSGCPGTIRADTHHSSGYATYRDARWPYVIHGEVGQVALRERYWNDYRDRPEDHHFRQTYSVLTAGLIKPHGGLEFGVRHPDQAAFPDGSAAPILGGWLGSDQGWYGLLTLGDTPPEISGDVGIGGGYQGRVVRMKVQATDLAGGSWLGTAEMRVRVVPRLWIGGVFEWSSTGGNGVWIGRGSVDLPVP